MRIPVAPPESAPPIPRTFMKPPSLKIVTARKRIRGIVERALQDLARGKPG